ncbi:MAG: beta strand repeat-containing protein [Gemmataceae bacterium]
MDFTAAGSAAESVTVTNDGSNILLSGSVSGTLSCPSGSVSAIVVTDSGGSTNQSLLLAGNGSTSLDGGFTLNGIETVTVNSALEASGTGTVSVSGGTIAIAARLTTGGGDIALTASNGITLTDAVSTGGGSLILNADSDNDGVGALTVTATTMSAWSQQAQQSTSYHFGYALAMSGDGTTAIFGTHTEAVGSNGNQGAAYVFTRAGNVWTQQQRLVANDGSSADNFGISVALSSDGNTAIIGAWMDTVSMANQGSAYVFTRSGTLWTQQQRLTASDAGAQDYFGLSVGVSGDGNTAIVGAYADDIGANVDQGSAYVFTRANSAWTQQQKLTATDGSGGDSYGVSVAISTNGFWAIVGAYYSNVGANADQGAAYVYQASAGWAQQAKLTASDGAASDLFGVTVALASDGATAAVGASCDDITSNVNQGSAYVFTRAGTVWSQQQKLTAGDGAANDQFGGTVALSADGNTIVVGSFLDDVSANTDQGSAYVFTRTSSVWTQRQLLIADNGGANDDFGRTVAISEDGNAVYIGAYLHDVTFTDEGMSYYFKRGGSLAAGSGNIAITAADADLKGSLSSGSTISVVPSQPGRLIDLGKNVSGALSLTAGEFANFSLGNGTLAIGDGKSGGITVDAAVVSDAHLYLTGSYLNASQAIVMASNKNLNVSALGTVWLFNSNADFSASGTGSIGITTKGTVKFNTGSSIVTVNGALTLSANQQGTPTSGNFIGIDVLNASITVNGSGALTMLGRGGNDSTGSQFGIRVSGSVIAGGTAGSLTNMQGQAGAGGSGSNKGLMTYGGSTITTNGGGLFVSGTGGGMGTSSSNNGIEIGGIISAGGSGSISIIGTAAATTGIAAVGVYVNGGQLSANGGIKVNGYGGVASNTDAYGVEIDNGGKISSGGLGNLEIVGQAGGGSNSSHNDGIHFLSGTISAAGSGSVSVTGTGYGTTGGFGYNGGVYMGSINSQITSNGGNIKISGTGGFNSGGSNNHGVNLQNGTIKAGGMGTVEVVGKGGTGPSSSSHGVYLATGAPLISSSGGDVSVTGTCAASGSGGTNCGVQISAGTISAGGSGNVTVTGTGGGTTSNGNSGVVVTGSSSQITSNAGNVKVIGNGGGAGSVIGSEGVEVSGGGIITAGAMGTVEVIGVGAGVSVGAGNANYGVYVATSPSKITSSGGDVTINGTGGGNGSSGGNYGVYGINSAAMLAGGTGNLNIIGKGGSSTGSTNYGVALSTNSTLSAGGSIAVTGIEGSGASPLGIILATNSLVTSGAAGNITFVADSNSIAGSSTINAGANTVAFRQRTNGIAIGLGAADVVGSTLGLTDGELDCVIADKLLIGDSNSGEIVITADINRTGATNVVLSTSSSIGLSAGLDSGGGAIIFNAAGAITQTAGTIQTSTGSFNINAPGQTATFNSSGNSVAQLIIPSSVTSLVNGSFESSGAVQVDGTLGGSGSVGTTTVTGTGKIAPGNSPGKLATVNIAFNSGSVINIELNGPNVGNDYDQLVVNGTVDLGGATLSPSLGYTPSVGQVFKIIDNDGTGDAATGTFNGYIEGATVTISGVNFTISYQGGDGNDVTLTRQAAAPPPPTVTSVILDEGSGATVGGINGTTQRSEVRRIIVTFSEAVNFTGALAAAFSLSRSATSSSPGSAGPVGLVANPNSGPASSVTITFTGGFANSTGSLMDGLYNFAIDAQQISGAGGKLNGSGGGAGTDYTVIGSTANKWFRFYGDQNSDGTVDQTDYLVFRNALANGPNSVFDYQNSGDVDQVDYLEFRNRLAGAP